MVAMRGLPTGARGTGGSLTGQCVCEHSAGAVNFSGETQEVHSSKEPCGTSESETRCPVLSCNVASNLKHGNDLKMPLSLCSILSSVSSNPPGSFQRAQCSFPSLHPAEETAEV